MHVHDLLVHPCLDGLGRHTHATPDLDFRKLAPLDEPLHGSGRDTECFRGLLEREQEPLTIESNTFTT
jgi:hypothetical protein